ncbi:unnamed protein product [Larinioides sclopetarius]|uniref:Reverse transcriptase/retrotransposon-derived protein RNase H-like domain-containing protein n=1 Tax=Larinioides sclopetarius TaxID=280406 RepID=A0AAV2A9N6_9ARAC
MVDECNEVFEQGEQLLESGAVLAHYNENLPLQVSWDALPIGVGAVLSHIVNNGEKLLHMPLKHYQSLNQLLAD